MGWGGGVCGAPEGLAWGVRGFERGTSGSRVLGWGAANVGCGQMPDHFEMTADVPGFTKDQINVEVHEVRCGGHSGRCGCGGRWDGYSASCVCAAYCEWEPGVRGGGGGREPEADTLH